MLMELPKTPIVNVHTTENRGFTPEEIAKRCCYVLSEFWDKNRSVYSFFRLPDEVRNIINKSSFGVICIFLDRIC